MSKKYSVYGIEWDVTSSTTINRTDEAANFVNTSSFDNCMPWAEIRTEIINGVETIKIPKFWYKKTKTGSTFKLQIADGPIYGFSVSPIHRDMGDGEGEQDCVYVGMDLVSDYKLAAKMGYALHSTMLILFIIEFATTNDPDIDNINKFLVQQFMDEIIEYWESDIGSYDGTEVK